MSTPYRRRRPHLVRNLWVYRKLVLLAMALGLVLWFIWINNAAVIVHFPFGLGAIESTSGVVILLSVLAGVVLSALAVAVFVTARQLRRPPGGPDEPVATGGPGKSGGLLDDDLPPPGYAARAEEGFPGTGWSAR
jgi:uncharacterized integral membrane protein